MCAPFALTHHLPPHSLTKSLPPTPTHPPPPTPLHSTPLHSNPLHSTLLPCHCSCRPAGHGTGVQPRVHRGDGVRAGPDGVHGGSASRHHPQLVSAARSSTALTGASHSPTPAPTPSSYPCRQKHTRPRRICRQSAIRPPHSRPVTVMAGCTRHSPGRGFTSHVSHEPTDVRSGHSALKAARTDGALDGNGSGTEDAAVQTVAFAASAGAWPTEVLVRGCSSPIAVAGCNCALGCDGYSFDVVTSHVGDGIEPDAAPTARFDPVGGPWRTAWACEPSGPVRRCHRSQAQPRARLRRHGRLRLGKLHCDDATCATSLATRCDTLTAGATGATTGLRMHCCHRKRSSRRNQRRSSRLELYSRVNYSYSSFVNVL